MKIYENHAQDARYDEKDTCPTITSRYGTGGGNVPLVLMDQGGGVMSIEYDKVGTLRAQTHGHEPLILDEGGGVTARLQAEEWLRWRWERLSRL